MIDLCKKVLPSAVEVGGQYFEVKTDFQYWIRFTLMLEEKPLFTDFDFLYKNKIPEDRIKGFEALKAFAYPVHELPRAVGGNNSDEIPFSYELDADLIYSAFMQQYGIDLVSEKLHLHWYKFRALFDGLKDCKFTDIVGYRLFTPGAKLSEYDRSMLRLRDAWRIYPELDEETKKEMAEFDRLFT